MPNSNNNIVDKKPCPLCPNGEWSIKHFNNQTFEPKYASGTCGCQIRAKNNQQIFEVDTRTGAPDLNPPVRVDPGDENTQIHEPIVGNPGNDQKPKEEDGWTTCI